MLKILITAMTALSLTIASVAPVQANGIDREDVGKIIIGIAAIAALNAYLENQRRDDDDDRDRDRASSRNNNSWADLNRPRPREQVRRRNLPSDCLRRVNARGGVQHIYTQSCLDRNYAQVDSLPNRCRVRLQTQNGPRRGYDPLCLHEAGYRATRRN